MEASLKTFAPGKLVIAGEWAVLGGHPAIVAAIDKGVTIAISENDREFSFDLPDLSIKTQAKLVDGKIDLPEQLIFLKTAIETLALHSPNLKNCAIKIDSSATVINGRKVGFGSSAGVTVATISALLQFNQIPYTADLIFKLATSSHYLAQGKSGSGFDIAAATFGGTFAYTRFDANCSDFSYQALKHPKNLQILVGFTGESASTKDLIQKMTAWQAKHPKQLAEIYQKISDIVKDLIQAWKESNQAEILRLINLNQELLIELDAASGVGIVTERLAKLHEIAKAAGAAGKLAGAGGGDCGIALTFDKQTAEQITKEWQENNIQHLCVNCLT